MRTKTDVLLKKMIEQELIQMFQDNRDEIRKAAKQQILAMQNENKHSYNLRRRVAATYKVGDIVAIKRTQLGGGLKLKPKYLGPYRVTKVKPKDTYDVVKESLTTDGPRYTIHSRYIRDECLEGWPSCGNRSGILVSRTHHR